MQIRILTQLYRVPCHAFAFLMMVHLFIIEDVPVNTQKLAIWRLAIGSGECPHPKSLPHKRRRDFDCASLPFPHFGPGMGEMSSIFTTPAGGGKWQCHPRPPESKFSIFCRCGFSRDCPDVRYNCANCAKETAGCAKAESQCPTGFETGRTFAFAFAQERLFCADAGGVVNTPTLNPSPIKEGGTLTAQASPSLILGRGWGKCPLYLPLPAKHSERL